MSTNNNNPRSQSAMASSSDNDQAVSQSPSAYMCDLCGFTTLRMNNFIDHRRFQHQFSPPRKTFACKSAPKRSLDPPSVTSVCEKRTKVRRKRASIGSTCSVDSVKDSIIEQQVAGTTNSSCRQLFTGTGTTINPRLRQLLQLKEEIEHGNNNTLLLSNGRTVQSKVIAIADTCTAHASTSQHSQRPGCSNYDQLNARSSTKCVRQRKHNRSLSLNNLQPSRQCVAKSLMSPHEPATTCIPETCSHSVCEPLISTQDSLSTSCEDLLNNSQEVNELNIDGGAAEDDDDDSDLPSFLTPSKHDIVKHDLVWARVRKNKVPFWPALVMRVVYVGKKKRRMSKICVKFIGDSFKGNAYMLTYNDSFVMNYNYENSKQNMDAARGSTWHSRLVSDTRKLEDYLCLKANGQLLVNPEEYFQEYFAAGARITPVAESLRLCNSTANNIINPEMSRVLDHSSTICTSTAPSISSRDPVHMHLASDDAAMNDDEGEQESDDGPCDWDTADDEEEDEEEDDDENSTSLYSNKHRKRLEKRKERNQILVDCIKSAESKEYLANVYFGKTNSELHKKFHGTVAESKRIRNLRYLGPFTRGDDAQLDEIVETLMLWLQQITNEMISTDYLFDVWLPEAIVYALMKAKSYHKSKAWKLFYKGTRMVKEEREILEKQTRQNAKNISPEDREYYNEKLRNRMERLGIILPTS